MKKLLLGISAMFLFFTGVWPSWAQWPEFDPDTKGKLGTKVTDSLGGRWRFTTSGDRYFSSSVDDGFGGVWGFGYSSPYNTIGMSRSFNDNVRYYDPIPRGIDEYPYNNQLKFDERSLPLDAGLGVAFYGYLTALNKAGVKIEATLWLSMDTGEISDVWFRAVLPGNELMLSVPPRNFSLYEDILKKTVKFEIPTGIVHSEKMERYNVKPESIYYQYDIEFPAPAEGEPDFLAMPE